MPGPTAYVYDPRFLEHRTDDYVLEMPNGELLEPEPHPSSARITRRTAQLIEGSGIGEHFVWLSPRLASQEEIGYYHDFDYIDQVQQTAEAGGGWLDKETPIAAGSWDAALLAAGASLELVDKVISGQVRNAYGLLRPPGHHAMPGKGMGFCVFNNVVIATRHAQRIYGVQRVMIIDWDVHHGNGTQAAFWDDPDVLFVSIHQENWYPARWGAAEQVGGERAEGKTVNIPLPPGSGNSAYLMALDRIVGPIAQEFQPELIFLSAGQDASMMDPLGQMMVTMSGYRRMTRLVTALAEDVCGGRLIGVQEGGYSAMYVPFCTLAVLEGITGKRTSVQDPYTGDSELDAAEREFRPHQVEAVEAARRIQARWWAV